MKTASAYILPTRPLAGRQPIRDRSRSRPHAGRRDGSCPGFASRHLWPSRRPGAAHGAYGLPPAPRKQKEESNAYTERQAGKQAGRARSAEGAGGGESGWPPRGARSIIAIFLRLVGRGAGRDARDAILREVSNPDPMASGAGTGRPCPQPCADCAIHRAARPNTFLAKACDAFGLGSAAPVCAAQVARELDRLGYFGFAHYVELEQKQMAIGGQPVSTAYADGQPREV